MKRRQPNPWFKRGTVYRRAVDVLRTATEPLTAREIAERVLVAANVTNPDKDALADLAGSVLASLRNHKGKGIERAVSEIAADLHAATGPEQRLGLLLTKWGFRLPTASAILTVLFPDVFTIYDIRVCNALDAFHQLGGMTWSPKAWKEYQRFICAVRDAAPQGLSLRDCDRWLWGQDKRETLRNELIESG